MKLSWDEAKRRATLDERGLDFASAAELFAGDELTGEDVRFAYGERRFISFGFVRTRLCAVVWTPRDGGRHIISMRKANEREKKWFQIETGPG
ncbi:MAG TPA: BrnT family toxin [Aestuariivirga sp.]|nr:BrnT family toxin [Hyphomicrobiales bacterium]MBP9175692.1 BrnT family toxin [Hyphomicrobiales bacterium]MBZ0260188.1 BrnT family toxin [Hyphomicrobiales bacterium]MCC7482289.1 BrnT family toxin [Hyphomicrobiales bacterium]HQY72393.1 BrnT family toxin [Aestuariivirga sp.]